MKITFLDIDGVINCSNTKERFHGLIGVDPEKIKLVKQIVDATGAKLVLSSTWRMGWFYEGQSGWESGTEEWHYLRDAFAAQGLYFLDYTPLHKNRHRGTEIQMWLDSAGEEWDVESYVVIDDDMYDIRDMHKGHMVKTSFSYGLQPGAVKMAIDILNKEKTNGT